MLALNVSSSAWRVSTRALLLPPRSGRTGSPSIARCCSLGSLLGVITFAGYILGFPTDTPASIKNDIEIIKRELPIDILEFYCLTPLPGSEDHQILWNKKVWMDPDLNKYDSEHAVTDHPHMSLEAWEEVYTEAWKSYYTPQHMEAILRRACASGIGFASLTGSLLLAQCQEFENVHPMQGGLLRAKFASIAVQGLALNRSGRSIRSMCSGRFVNCCSWESTRISFTWSANGLSAIV